METHPFKFRFQFVAFLVLTLILMMLLLFAFSPHAMAATVDVSPIYQQFVDPLVSALLQGLALAIAGWFTYLIQRYAPAFLKTWLETKAAAALNTALQNGVVIAMHKLDAVESVNTNLQVKGQVSAWAAQYAIDHAPGAVARFGLDPNQLALKALAYVPVVPTTTDTTSATINNTIVTTGTLEPATKP
jgi:hypothetical protein